MCAPWLISLTSKAPHERAAVVDLELVRDAATSGPGLYKHMYVRGTHAHTHIRTCIHLDMVLDDGQLAEVDTIC